MKHVPVLLKEVLEVMVPVDGGRYFDGTLGDGGHAMAILDACSPSGELAGCDLDRDALTRVSQALTPFHPRTHLFHANYASIDDICDRLGWVSLDGVLVDLGMSSGELDDEARGFSFQGQGPLDMRYDRDGGLSAHDVVNAYDEELLAGIIREYGEERFARRIARRIVESRPVKTTQELADIVGRAIPRRFWPARIHPATRTFQAIRLEVNAELDNLKTFLPKASALLAEGGVLAVISFHSLEDRIVKRFFAGHTATLLHRPGLPLQREAPVVPLRRITKKPVLACDEEVRCNPRARSAKLRAARRVS
ncbi:MAG TPA: 16S rRNA (cytosine(1402)-N(4))-methyltransferase RsmH [Deltaproteobacteria bacterium]|jgi:16S rRNA (cytosine1402-N4)-methyltransferase|nr:16S rRNA (cytosine(1402)-N(4))-methyltransferase RsmH [Deltaproteobacteria bacterium]HRW81401.1 16S rRNA (cytosine(1402)-N(4))-methyltransferase RsmH [Desulfomonilia bacterium]NMD39793.1 16S rRNA (cytosine(1402)-N(4))-methyltransferase RsmH [Deltaproteobacteria bacterium]HNQ85682.1 16S rRNA (cytosine(1402)-N(4))-methyltransferase RsmH [Deltaproteobacteria bacterium]HNS89851.1 16S rRNA (cytosine(1402)-N(4))-methyltransferase RsmH [Deltaproteobacteria bacterium]